MKRRLPFRYIEPIFFAGLCDDPLLLVHIRPLGKGLLFDCGQLHHLAKRELKSIIAIFISHAHMDHFMGLDTFIRHNHVSPKTVDIFGPPGITAKVASKLASYDWNLAEPSWCSFRVNEISTGTVATSIFIGPQGFSCGEAKIKPRPDAIVYTNVWLTVEAVQCDHHIPSLAFRIRERECFSIDEAKLEKAGLAKGSWLRELKKGFYRGFDEEKPVAVLRQRGGEVVAEVVEDGKKLYGEIHREQRRASIGYVTDVGNTTDNLEKITGLLDSPTLLICECSFPVEDRDKALVSHHFCSSDLNRLVEVLQPRFILPMHLSKSYLGRTELILRQLQLPAGTTLLRMPERVTPRPIIAAEVPSPAWE